MSTLALPSTPVLDRISPPSRRLPNRPRLFVALRDAAPTYCDDSDTVSVPGATRPFRVGLCSKTDEYEQVFRLLANNYQASGYEPASNKPYRFTSFHALPQTAVFVTKLYDQVLATLSLVPDNPVLGLPMEAIYPEEINALRQEGRNLVEVTSLADRDLNIREFVPVFVGLMRVMVQFGASQGADTWVITVNPRHCLFYRKVMGFVPIGPRKSYPSVQNHPAEAFAVTPALLAAHSPTMHNQIFGEQLSEQMLAHVPLSGNLVRHFAARSSQTSLAEVEDLLAAVDE